MNSILFLTQRIEPQKAAAARCGASGKVVDARIGRCLETLRAGRIYADLCAIRLASSLSYAQRRST